MGVGLDRVVLWGRNLTQYEEMFNLTDSDLGKNIVGVADGPACANAELFEQGIRYTSIDPIYKESVDDIRASFLGSRPDVMARISALVEAKTPGLHKNVEELGRDGDQVFDTFIADYEKRKDSGAYIYGELPSLPIADQTYDLALSSYLLFAYSGVLDYSFHLAAVRELLRVAREVRMYPVTDVDNYLSAHIPPMMQTLRDEGIDVYLEDVPFRYVDVKTNNQMLVARHL
ncbi:Uncharacterised protein [BD1-7 clade bacterium]|nr:Uncharacterised protein [BD1-7 clade bacterium]